MALILQQIQEAILPSLYLRPYLVSTFVFDCAKCITQRKSKLLFLLWKWHQFFCVQKNMLAHMLCKGGIQPYSKTFISARATLQSFHCKWREIFSLSTLFNSSCVKVCWSAPLRSLFMAAHCRTSSEIGLHMENCKISSHECHSRLEIGFLNTGILSPVQAGAHGLLRPPEYLRWHRMLMFKKLMELLVSTV